MAGIFIPSPPEDCSPRFAAAPAATGRARRPPTGAPDGRAGRFPSSRPRRSAVQRRRSLPSTTSRTGWRHQSADFHRWRFQRRKSSDAIRSALKPATAKLFQEGHDPFALPGLHFTRETAGSVAINNIHCGAIIMAGLGYVHRRPRAPPPPAQSRSRGFEHRLCRLRSHWNSRAPHYRRREAGEHFR